MRARLTGGLWTAGLMTLAMAGSTRKLVAESDQASQQARVTASAEIAGKRYDYSGPGECYYTAGGSIYEQPAAMWHARFEARGNPMSHANLAIWQLREDRSIRVNLSIIVGNVSYDIYTATPDAARGTAVGGVEKSATGGRVTAEGRTANAVAVRISVSCSRFAAPEDNGD